MPLRLVSLLALSALAVSPLLSAPITFTKPETLRFDGNSMIIDGKPVFIYSGAFHYFRCPKELWRDRFAKIKEAGFNTVETYVPWNMHEKERPPGGLKDFSKMDLSDLTEWMRMAHEEFGLYTIIRPGPYICAEWSAGGYPRWLLAEVPEKVAKNRPIWMRSDDPSYLDWSQHWMDAVAREVAPFQITRKPAGSKGMILFQIENEYDFWNMPNDAKITHLKRLKRDAVAAGIEVPLFTCLTSQTRGSKDPELAEIFDVANLYNRDNIAGAVDRMTTFKKQQPGKPAGVGELQGGWFAKVGGGKLSEEQEGVDEKQIVAITLAAIASGASVTNYYMLFGGSHFGGISGARGQLTTYDYNAPIRETGGVGLRYAAVKGIGEMIREWGTELAVSQPVKITGQQGADGLDFTVKQTPAGETFVFVFNKSRKDARKGVATLTLADGAKLTVPYDLGAFDYRICRLAKGVTDAAGTRWLPQPGELPERPAADKLPKSIRIANAKVSRENSPTGGWKTLKPGGEHLAKLGVFESFPVAYATQVRLTEAEAKNFTGLGINLFNDDRVVARVNGTVFATRNNASKGRQEFALGDVLVAGDNRIEIFHEDLDSHNWDFATQDFYGVKGAALTRQAPSRDVAEWKVRLVADEAEGRRLATAADDGKGSPITFDAATLAELNGVHQPGADLTKIAAAKQLYGKKGVALYRTKLAVTPGELAAGLTRLVIERIDDKGEVFINGRSVGKHNDWKTPFTFDAAKVLRAGDNDIAVVVTNSDGQGGITRPVRLESAAKDINKTLALSWARVPSGTKPTGPVTDVALDTASKVPDRGTAHPKGKADALLTRYEMKFTLPKAEAGVWVPWHARLDASGNGQLYLNGHHVGRYFEAGPQRAFYLPECWLNIGGDNTLVLEQLPTNSGAVLRAAEIAPMIEHAEVRK